MVDDNSKKTGRDLFEEKSKSTPFTESIDEDIINIGDGDDHEILLELEDGATSNNLGTAKKRIDEDEALKPKPKKRKRTPVKKNLKIRKKTPDVLKTKEGSSSKDNIVALHINSEVVAIVQTKFDGINYTIQKVQLTPIVMPEITEENVFSQDDPEATLYNLQLEAIENCFSSAGISKNSPNIVSSIPGQCVLEPLTVKNKTVEEIDDILPDLVQSPVDRMSSKYEYSYLRSTTDPNGLIEHKILAAVVEQSAFFQVNGMLNAAEVECNILDLDVMAVVNLYLESVKPSKGMTSCILDIGHDYSSIIIHSNLDGDIYKRNLDFTFKSMTRMLAKNRNIPIIQAEQMLYNTNFYDYMTKAFEMETEENLNKLYPIKDYIKTKLINELQKTFQFYVSKNPTRIPSKIYITGKGAEVKNFLNFLEKTTDINCEVLDVSDFFEGREDLKMILKSNYSKVYKAVGLSLRYE